MESIKRNKAFTLIELLVVIAILGILILMAAPKLFNYTQKAELATIQSDVKVMQGKISEELMSDGGLLAEWDSIATDELITLTEGGNLYEVKGKVNPESLNADSFKIVSSELKNKINTKLKGDFYADNNGKVYYKHIRKLNVDFPSDGNESSNNGIYTQEEIDNLVNNEDYIEVKTAEDLNNVRNNLAGKYIQTANIDVSDFESFEPIGNSSTIFSGTYDGGGFEISNLTINKPSLDHIGLFGFTSSATIKDVGLKDVDIVGRDYVGGLVGLNDTSTVSNSYATGEVNGTRNRVGGLVGVNSNSTVNNSYATGAVTGAGSYVGGLVGLNNSSIVKDSYATGAVFGTGSHVGGLVGYSNTNSTVSNSYATGAVTGTVNHVGGLVGYNHNMSTVIDSYATGAVFGTGSYVGGLVGNNQSKSTVSNSYATGEVNGFNYVGGLVGQNNSSTVSKSYYDTATTGLTSSSGGTGKSTEEMKMKSTYNDWNFDDVWQIEEGISYPKLR